MTPTSFRTQPLPLQDQFEAWREWYTTVFDVVAEPPSSGEFSAEMHLWTLGGLAMSHTIAPSVDVVRTKHHLRRNPVPTGSSATAPRALRQNGGYRCRGAPGVHSLWPLGQEFLYVRTHVDRIQFVIARDTFRDIAPLLDAACGLALDTPLGRLLGDHMMTLRRNYRRRGRRISPELVPLSARWSPRRPHHPRNARLSPSRKSISAARSACVRRCGDICGRRLWSQRPWADSLGCPAPTSIGCLKTR